MLLLGRHKLFNGDCREHFKEIEDCSVDSCVTDPPYELGFMGKKWDASGIAYDVNVWREVLRILKPGAHLLAFGGTRTYHRMTCAIEDAGFEIRDQLQWLYGQGFPKSLDISKAIDKEAGAERVVVSPYRYDSRRREGSGPQSGDNCYGQYQRAPIGETAPATPLSQHWSGWGTALKPGHEPICLARKPISEDTIAQNVCTHGTGGLNIDGCRIETRDNLNDGAYAKNPTPREQMWGEEAGNSWRRGGAGEFQQPSGRFPANVLLDEEAAAILDKQAGELHGSGNQKASWCCTKGVVGFAYSLKYENPNRHMNNGGPASRFFYVAKASTAEREAGLKSEEGRANLHPTVKPVALLRYLCRFITPPGGVILDPFIGSGSTFLAAEAEGFSCWGIEQNSDYCRIAQQRLEVVLSQPTLALT